MISKVISITMSFVLALTLLPVHVMANENTAKPSAKVTAPETSPISENLAFTYDSNTETATIITAESGKNFSLMMADMRDGVEYDGNVRKIVFSVPVVANVDINYAFYSAPNNRFAHLDEIQGLDMLDTSNVISMDWMFLGYSGTSLDLGGFDTSRVTGMSGVFFECSNLTSLDLGSFDTSRVEGMFGMFMGCTKLTQLNLGNFDTSSATDMSEMFKLCTSLTSLDLSSFSTPELLSYNNTFYGTDSLEVVKTSADISNAITKQIAASSTAPGTGKWYATGSSTAHDRIPANTAGTWHAYTSISENLSYTYDSETETATVSTAKSGKNFSKMMEDMRHGVGFEGNVTKIVFDVDILPNNDISYAFYCTPNNRLAHLREIQGLDRLDTSDVTHMRAMFAGYLGDTLDLSGLVTSNVIDMTQMFEGCTNLTSLDLTHLDTSSVRKMEKIFKNCSGLTSLDLSNFNTSSARYIAHMFQGCSSLTHLDLSGFSTTKVSNMNEMFKGCSSLRKLNLSSFDTSQVTTSINMFIGATLLEVLKTGANISSDITKQIAASNTAPGTGRWYTASNNDALYRTPAHTVGIWYAYQPIQENLSFKFDSKSGTATITTAESGTHFNQMMDDMKNGVGFEGDVTRIVFDVDVVVNADISNAFDCRTSTYPENRLALLREIQGLDRLDTSTVTHMRALFAGYQGTALDLGALSTSNVIDMTQMFEGCTNLASLDISHFDTFKVRYIEKMFANCLALTSIDLSNFSTSSARYIGHMFHGCSKLTRLDLSGFDTTNINFFKEMFVGADSLEVVKTSANITNGITNQIAATSTAPGTGKWYASNSGTALNNIPATTAGTWYAYIPAKESLIFTFDEETRTATIATGQGGKSFSKMMADMRAGMVFKGYVRKIVFSVPVVADADISYCFSSENSNRLALLQEIQGLDKLDTSGVTNMSNMFDGCTSITSLDLSNFDTSNVSEMSGMFMGCSGLTSLDLGSLDTSNVSEMSGMFMGCSALESLDLSSFDTPKVANMGDIFHGCLNLTSVNISSFETLTVTMMNGMFEGCISLTSVDLGNFDTTNVTDMNKMFDGCINLASLDLSNFNTLNVSNMGNMFNWCSSLTSLDLSSFDTRNATQINGMFEGCSGLTNLDLGNFDTSNITDMSGMFKNCSTPTSLDLSGFDTSNATNMSGMFEGCSGLTSLDLSNFRTTNVIDMSRMFEGCSGLASLDLGNFDTSNVSNMSGIFDGCSGLTSLDLSGLDTSNVTDMSEMFHGCSGLMGLDLRCLDTSKVTDMTKMFAWCSSLKNLDLSNFDTSSVVVSYDAFAETRLLDEVKTGANITSDITRQMLPSNSAPGTGKWYAVGNSTALDHIPASTAGMWCAYIKDVNFFTVTINSNGGTDIPSLTVEEGMAISKPAAPAKAGYGFAGWYSDKACENSFDFGLAITENTTIHAAWRKLYDDVGEPGAFFYEAVYEGAHLGFMTGYTGTNLFGPWDNMDRQTVAVALYKFAGSPEITQKQVDSQIAKFTDGKEIPSWAKKGIAWCAMTGKLIGVEYDDGTFSAAPAQEATREMIATFLWRYAEEPAVTASPEFDTMPDKGSVSAWATTGMKWCMSKGIITGVEVEGENVKYIQPFGSAYRGSMITMLVRGKKDLML